MAEAQDRPRQACDNCRFRKVKCDRGQPCRNCETGAVRCEYLHAVRRKGPRTGQGRRQAQIRRGLPRDESSLDTFRVFTPVTESNLHSLGANSAGSVSSSDELHSRHSNDQVDQGSSWHLGQTSSAEGQNNAQPDVFGVSRPWLDDLELDTSDYSKHLSQSLAAHVQVFLKYLFPIMPIIDDEFITDALRIDDLPPSRYAVIIALCAATRIQLRMDNSRNSIGEGPDADIPLEPQLTGEMLVGLAENALRQYSVIDDISLDSILASFFLFASYGNLNNARHAWFYLNQSISLAHALDITTEAGYRDLGDIEREKRRRVFWVLFVTERTFALQHRRGVQLRSTINKPQIIDSDCPVVMHDFVNHIRVFEQLPSSLYVWQSQGDGNQLSLTHSINDKLCTVQANQSVIESQRFDTLLTQQWLRIAMWRLAFGKKPSSACSGGALLPVSLPMEAGRLIMGALSSVGSKSKDCHGIGMEQKLFDIGISLADSARLPVWRNSGLEIGPRDLLVSIVGALSKARGCPSHLLPNLLEYSGDLLGPAGPCTVVDMGWQMLQGPENYNEPALVEDITAAEDCVIGWASKEDTGLSNLQIPSLSPLCNDATLSSFDQADFA
ncbi:putative sucrose utilization protein SUC1 [Paramyrothecium foliicola]|nr:putative sucrose utilization protein SUC1 [Paramyrothecium foliicola]